MQDLKWDSRVFGPSRLMPVLAKCFAAVVVGV